MNRSVNNAEIYNPKEAISAGFLDVIVPESELIATAVHTAKMFAKLNPIAHATTKLRVRKQHLENLKNAIELDLIEEISINP